LELNTWYNL